MGIAMRKGICLGAAPASLGVLSYSIIRWDFPDLEGNQTLSIIFISALIIVLSSFYIRRRFNYLWHEFLFSINIAFFLLAIVDLFKMLGPPGSRSIILYIFSSIAPVRDMENLRYLLSAVSQSLAALFGIAFSLTLIGAQLYTHLYDLAQVSRHILKKKPTYLIVLSYVTFILYSFFLLKLVVPDSANVSTYLFRYEKFVVLDFIGTIFCLSLLVPYLMSITAELDPAVMTRNILSEAREEKDDKKRELVERIASNMVYWHQSGKRAQFAFAKVQLDYFLTDIEDEIEKETLRGIKFVINSLDDIIDKDSELVPFLMREYINQAKEVTKMKSKKNTKPKILRGLDFYRDYSRDDFDVKKGELQLITSSLFELAGIVHEYLPLESRNLIELKNPFQIEEEPRKGKKNGKDIETFDIYLATNLVNLGILYWSFREFEKAEESYRRAKEVYEKLAEKDSETFEEDIAEILDYSGNLYRDLREFEKAEESYTEALKIYRKRVGKGLDASRKDMAGTLRNLGHLYSDLIEFEMAEEYFGQALKTYKELAEKEPEEFEPDIAMTLNNLGSLYRDSREFEKAEESYTEALRIYRRSAKKDPDTFNPYMAETFNNLGGLNYDLRRFRKTENYYSKAKVIFNELAERDPDTFRFDLAKTHNNLGSLYRNLREFEMAEESYTEALKTYKELAEKEPKALNPYMAMTLNNLGHLYSDLREFEMARKFYTEALNICRELAKRDSSLRIFP